MLAILPPHVGAELEKVVIPYAEKLRQEGHKLGLEDGRKLGLEDGQRQILIHLLESRFGSLPAAVRKRLERATDEETKRWAVRVLDAGSLEEVFSAE